MADTAEGQIGAFMKKFVASYSGGKDSVLAIHRAIKSGYQPIQLITTYNMDHARSWFHGIPETVLNSVSASLGIPIQLVKTAGAQYAENFEKALLHAKNAGAETCVFGDIDIEEHLQWCSQRCKNVGMEAYFPLWQGIRKSLAYEFIDEGYTANITIIDTRQLSGRFLGETLTKDIIDAIEEYGADACGENGEYHTFVSNGPIFTSPIHVVFGEKISVDGYAILPIIE